MNRSLKMTLMSAVVVMMMGSQAYAGQLENGPRPHDPVCKEMLDNLVGNISFYNHQIRIMKAYYDTKIHARRAIDRWMQSIRVSPLNGSPETCRAYYYARGAEGAVIIGRIIDLVKSDGWHRKIPEQEFMEFVTNWKKYQ